jgi:O-antigen ligase
MSLPWKDYPIIGVGFGEENERRLLSRYTHREGETDLVIHNTYLQILVDSGLIAFLIYSGLLLTTIVWLGSARQRAQANSQDVLPCLFAIQAALIAFAIGAIFLSREEFDLTYMLLMTAAAWWQIQGPSSEAQGDSMYAEVEPSAIAASA